MRVTDRGAVRFAGEIRHKRLLRYLMLGGFDC